MISDRDNELNAEWVKVNQEIQHLNHKRKQIFEKFKESRDDVTIQLKWESSPSMYYDFFGQEIDMYKRENNK